MTGETLAFVDLQGNEDGRIYDLFFSLNSDSVWGDNWNICPSAIVPGISIDENCYSSVVRIESPITFRLAKDNTCFSMQDCIDGIIPLAFPDIDDGGSLVDGKALILRFGEDKDDVLGRISAFGGKVLMEHDRKDAADDMIDNLIDGMDNEDNFDF